MMPPPESSATASHGRSQPGLAGAASLAGVFGRDAWVGAMCDPVRKCLFGVANKAFAAPDKVRAGAVLPVALQCAGVEFEDVRCVFFEMDDH